MCPPPKVKYSVTIYLDLFTLYYTHHLPSGNHHTVLCVYGFQFQIPHMSEIIWSLALSFLLAIVLDALGFLIGVF